MAKRGRKSAYDTIVKPRFDDILRWLRNGATEEIIYKNLGISKNAFYQYKKEIQEFNDLLKKGRESIVEELRGILMKKARGFEYKEYKRVTKVEDGETTVQSNEEYTKQALPDVAAANLLLKNYDKENWSNDPRSDDLKKAEFELKKKAFDKDNWESDL